MLIIDRLEGSWAILEWGDQIFQVPQSFLPLEAKEGDALTMTLAFDREAQDQSEARTKDLMDDLFE